MINLKLISHKLLILIIKKLCYNAGNTPAGNTTNISLFFGCNIMLNNASLKPVSNSACN